MAVYRCPRRVAVEEPTRVGRRITGQRSVEQDPDAERREARLVGREGVRDESGWDLLEFPPRAEDSDHRARRARPARPSCAAPRARPSATAPTSGARGVTPTPAPAAPGSRRRPAPRARIDSSRHPLSRFNHSRPATGEVPVSPRELGLGRIRVRHDRHAAKPQHVLDHRRRFPTERIRSGRHVERHQVAAVGADLDGVDAEHAVDVGGRQLAGRVAVVGHDHELQSRARRRGRNRLARLRAVGPGAVDVKRAGDGSRPDRRRPRLRTRSPGEAAASPPAKEKRRPERPPSVLLLCLSLNGVTRVGASRRWRSHHR